MGERGTAAGRIWITFMYRGAYIEHIVTQRAQIKTLFHWNSDWMLPQCFASMRIKDLQRIWPLAGEHIQVTLGSLYLGGTWSSLIKRGSNVCTFLNLRPRNASKRIRDGLDF